MARTVVAATVALWCGLAVLLSTPAAAERPFTARFAGNHAGNLTGTGNTLMTCPAADPACAGAQAGGNVNNNAFTMQRVDVDGDATTFT